MQSARGNNLCREDEPICCGVPWPEGQLTDPATLRLLDDEATTHMHQSRVLERWRDGSVRWLLVDWKASSARRYRLSVDGGEYAEPVGPRLAVIESGEGTFEIDTGPVRFLLSTGAVFPFGQVLARTDEVIDPANSVLMLEDVQNQLHVARIESLELISAGPIRGTVKLMGVIGEDSCALRLEAYLHFFAGSPTVRLQVTVTNPRAAGHPDGRWGLGNSGSVVFRALSLRLSLAGVEHDKVRYGVSPELSHEMQWNPQSVSLHQYSSGGDHWDRNTHQNGIELHPLRMRGYRMRIGDAESEGLRATPIVALHTGDRFVAVTMQHFWENFPKKVEARDKDIVLSLFPNTPDSVHELQGGEQKTHTFHVAFARDFVTETSLAWARTPSIAGLSPGWYSSSSAVANLLPRDEEPSHLYRQLVDSAIEGEHSFENKREFIDEYGWRNFGDIYADHEALYCPPGAPLVSHYNNQYDAIRGFAIQFMRSGDLRWFTQMQELASHVVDIDTYHTSQDKAAYNNGLFWHTDHYVDAGTSNHRSYPAVAGVAGGGPSPGHLYATGLLLHYLLTGDEQSHDTVISFGRYVIDCDDGRISKYRWLDGGNTGHATESGLDRFHGPGRTAANAITVLVDAARLSGKRAFLDKAEELINRCIHPADDLESRQLLDTEKRWYYTLFIKSLDHYLTRKAELGVFDCSFEYARAAILHYARWAREHEYPYLEKPERLEFPNETWAAQDMHKSEMFKIAAKLSTGEERETFMERATHFFDYSVSTLSRMATHSLTRPTVLMLSFGFSQGYFVQRGVPEAIASRVTECEFGTPTSFVPQKYRAIRKLLVIGVSSAMLCVLGFAFAVAS